jgi:hypothetical protein
MSQTKVKSGLLNFPDQTDFVKLPSGTTAQRPSSPEKGYSRYNTTDNKLEYWNGTIWQQLPGVVAPTIESVSYPGDDLAADPAGGQTITLTGTNFLNGASVEIDGTTASVVTVVSGTEITFTAPAKAAGDYDIVLTNGDNTTATFVDGITYNGLPSWTTPAGNLGSFPAGSTIPTITLVATEPDSGVVSYSVTTGALPTGLTLTGANIDGTVPTPAGQTTYNFSVTASDDENQESTERAFNIVVYLQVTNTVDEVDPFDDSSGIALYKLNGDATDESGNYDATASNITYSTGVFGQAAQFNGSSSAIYKIIPVRSVSFWVNLSNSSNIMPLDLRAGGGSEYVWFPGYVPNISSGTIYVNGAVSDGSALQANTWYHIVAIFANSTIPNPMYIGRRYSITGPDDWFSGKIDQFRVFNRTLTPLEVESLYREKIILCGGQADTLDILGDNSCIATYQLNGNANDLSGNYSGTPNDVSYGVGEFDLAGVFNGSSSYINLSDNSFKLLEYTVSAWVNSASTQNSQTIFSSYDYQGQSRGCSIRINDSNLIHVIGYKNNTQNEVFSSSQIQRNTWNHIVASVGQGSVSIYINGSLDNSGSWGGFNYFTTQPFSIGKLSGYLEQYWHGSLDQIRIFNKALSAGEVTTLYNETACDALACGGTTNTLDILSDGSCVAAYPLDGSPLDLSGNYNGVQTDVTYPVGKFDLGGSFNGTSSYIQANGAVTSSGAFSASFWFNFNSLGSYSPVIVANTLSGSNGGFQVRINYVNGKIEFFPEGGGQGTLLSDVVPAFNTWYHVVGTFDGSTFKLYVNNSLQTNTLSGTLNVNPPNDLYIGTSPSILTRVLDGQIDQVRIFNKALSAGEVTTLYNETACN